MPWRSSDITTKARFRMMLFVVSIAVAIVFIISAGQFAWNEVRARRRTLDKVQSESFRLAESLEHRILSMNSLLLRYGTRHDPQLWEQFERDSGTLQQWVKHQRTLMEALAEREELGRFALALDRYLKAAHDVNARVRTAPKRPTALDEFTEFERTSDELQERAFALARAHRAFLGEFFQKSETFLSRLRTVILGAQLFLIVLVATFAGVVYRGTIAPLQVQLLESRRQLERSEKLAALGTVASGVAHEIRNPLTAIKARLFTLRKRLEPETASNTDAAVIEGEIDRLDRIVHSVLRFARPPEPQMASVSAGDLLQKVATLVTTALEKKGIQLVVEPAPLLIVHADAEQMEQVLLNLVQNAAEASSENGTVTLRARRDRRRLKGQAVDVAVLEVIDAGRGIPTRVHGRVFDPFFTTKPAGTGLGLAIAARLIEKNGGTLQFQSVENHGSTFGIVLPLVAG